MFRNLDVKLNVLGVLVCLDANVKNKYLISSLYFPRSVVANVIFCHFCRAYVAQTVVKVYHIIDFLHGRVDGIHGPGESPNAANSS